MLLFRSHNPRARRVPALRCTAYRRDMFIAHVFRFACRWTTGWGTAATILAASMFALTTTGSAQTALDAYVAAPDQTSTWSVRRSFPGDGFTRHVIDLTSQNWRTSGDVNRTAWRHWLDVIIPDGTPIDTAMLHIGSGRNDSPGLPNVSQELVSGALATNSVMARLYTVPNQPLVFTDENHARIEDEIIAYTFDKFLDGGDDQWPLVLPMVKSAVRAMDTVQELVTDQTQGSSAVNDFTVYGVSKRGWTSWLTAAVDSRVRAIVPTVFDFLNTDIQAQHHREFYKDITDHIVGGYSWTLHDYVDADVFGRLDTPRGQELLDIFDPYRYRDRYENIPKLVINATGDEFSIPDSSQFYFDELPGTKRLRYVPNSGHTGFFETAVQFHQAIATGVDLPDLNWSIEDGGRRIEVTTDDTPLEVKLWQAHNPNARDFRHSISTPPPVWQSTLLSDLGGGQYIAEVPYPESGATALMVELAFDSGSATPFLFTTDISVLVPQAAILAGDYTQDGVVGAADYTVWRNNLGAPAGTLPNDADGGVIGQAQYATWKANYGATASSESVIGSAPVPEPATLLLACALVPAWLVYRSRRSCISLPPGSRTALVIFSFALAMTTLNGSADAQAFPNDNDGLLDVGEARGFPADPSAATGVLNLSRRLGERGIEDLDGASLLTSLQTLDLSHSSIRSIEPGDFSGLTNLKSLDLASNDLVSIEQGGFSGLANLQSLDLSRNSLRSIEQGDFKGLTNLQSLDLRVNSSLTSIEQGGFSGLANLQTLDLSWSSLSSIAHGGFNGLTNLQSLDLFNSSIRSIEPGDFSGLTNLKSLDLASNDLVSIEQGSFSGLTGLQSLDLTSNDLVSIEQGDFNGLPNLQSLKLGHNDLTSIEQGDFSGLTNLQSLSLGSNDLTSIEQGDFSGLTNLQSLSLGGSSLTSIEQADFSGLANLQSLTLNGELTSIEPGDFNGLPNLQSLELGHNDLTSIEQGDFSGLTNLQSLDLRSNSLQSIEPGSFSGLANLQSLDIRNNVLRRIEQGAFSGLASLQSLNLSINKLTSIEQADFSDLTSLQSLDLRRNSIGSIESGEFSGLTRLQSLDLSDNSLTSIEQGTFSGLTNLQSLELSRNAIVSIEEGTFSELVNLQTLDLRDNSIRSIEQGDFSGLTNLQSLDLWRNSITSIEQGDFSGLTNLQSLNLGGNSLTSIEQGDFSGLTNLQSLELLGNSITSIEQGDFDGLTNLQTLRLGPLTSIEPGAFEGLRNLETLVLSFDDLTYLDFTAATFDSLTSPAGGGFGVPRTGFYIPPNDRDEITTLVLDDAELSQGSFDVILRQTNSLVDVSLVGLTFSDVYPNGLSLLLGISTLDNVTVDHALFDMYADQFNTFAAMDGNTLTVVPEPTSLALLVLTGPLVFSRRYRAGN